MNWCAICQQAPSDGELLAEDSDGMIIPFPACTNCVETRIGADGTFDIDFNEGNALG